MAILTPEERIGTKIADKYRVDGVLGEGGWGVVFAGTHLWTDREVAIKLLHAQHARKDVMVRRFLKEAKAAARIKHPNVVDVLDMGRADDDVYLVLERLHGKTLSELLDEKEVLTPREALDVILPILDALAEAHDRKIVHRDIKPDNIFLADERDKVVPKILDFGIAKMMEGEGANTTTGQVVGTPNYMPPEQVQGAIDIAAPADVWSIGVVLFECLTGSLPYEGHNVANVLIQILTKEPPTVLATRPELGEEISNVIAKAMSKVVDDRYSSARELRDALAAVSVPEIAKSTPRREPVERVSESAVTRELAKESHDSGAIAFEPTMEDTPSPYAPEEKAQQPAPTATSTPEPEEPISLPKAPRSMFLPVIGAVALLAIVGVVFAIGSMSESAETEPAPIEQPAPTEPALVRDEPAPSEIVERLEPEAAPIEEPPSSPSSVTSLPVEPAPSRTKQRARPRPVIVPVPLGGTEPRTAPPPPRPPPRPEGERGTNDALIID